MTARERSRAAKRANVTRTAAAVVVARLLPIITRLVGAQVADLDAELLGMAARRAAAYRGATSDRVRGARGDELLDVLDRVELRCKVFAADIGSEGHRVRGSAHYAAGLPPELAELARKAVEYVLTHDITQPLTTSKGERGRRREVARG